MKLVLMIDGKEKIFTVSFVSGLMLRKLMQMDERIDYTDLSVDEYDELAGFVAEVFGNQFTADEFLDGVKSFKTLSVVGDVFSFVRTGEDPQSRNKPVKEDEEGNAQGK